MKKMMIAALLGLMTTGAVWAADPAVEVWQTEADDGAYAHVKMTACGQAVCGTIQRTFNASGEYMSENIGKQLVISMVPDGDGTYAGKVWRPSNNKIYTGKMSVSGNQLKLSGCVAGGLFCSAQDWTRVR